MKLILPIFLLILSIYLVYLSFCYSIYSFNSVSNEEISKIEDPCVIKQLKNKLNLTEKNNNALTGRNLERIKDFCKIKNEKESYSNQQIIKNQKELLNIKSNTNEYDEQGYF